MAKATKLANKASDVVSYRPKPTLSVDARDLPAIKDWQVGKTYNLCVKARLVSLSQGEEYELEYEDEGKMRREPARGRFRITSVKEEKYK